ncbi:hypothetical protein [Micromonospora costi]|uniref:Uncharacterized protein n=1 Tax=Micromonospora costi TaxID=1530042 RepID=A0A3B0AAC0_9ACTN|nr:hypothetical protein [Micromonospora costi]RKN56007.1 hypothetical protein D7193_15595 [Micromonospora costi]
MVTKLTKPGEAHTTAAGTLTLVASLTVDGGVALNTFAGPERIAELSGLTFTSRLDAAEVYRDIRDGGLAGMSLADIAEKVRERLVDIAAPLRGRAGYEPRVNELDRALDRVERLAFTSDLSSATAELNALADAVYGSVL